MIVTSSLLPCPLRRLIAFPGEDPSVAQVWDLQVCGTLTHPALLVIPPSPLPPDPHPCLTQAGLSDYQECFAILSESKTDTMCAGK